MARKLTIQVSDEIYDGLQRHVGKRGIASRWLEAQYREQAADEEAERETKEWLETQTSATAFPMKMGLGSASQPHLQPPSSRSADVEAQARLCLGGPC